MEESSTGRRRNIVLMVGAGIAILAVIGFGLKSLIGSSGSSSPKPPKISLLPNTPPPPPPPPKEEKKPEPPKENKEVREQPPEQKLTPPPETVMNGPKGDAPSDFKAGNVTKEDYSGKNDGVKGGTGRGILNPFNVYASSIKNELQKILARRSDLKRRQYRVEIHVWVGDDGKLRKSELLGTTNDADTDAAIRSALADLPAFSEPPPPRMPQPIRLRIVTSGRA